MKQLHVACRDGLQPYIPEPYVRIAARRRRLPVPEAHLGADVLNSALCAGSGPLTGLQDNPGLGLPSASAAAPWVQGMHPFFRYAAGSPA